MSGTGTLSRDSIVRLLSEVLQPLSCVHAFWEAGAAAFNRVDKWSDIDLYIVVDDAEAVSETFVVVEKALTDFSPIRLKHEVSWPPTSGTYQKFYRLSGTSEFLLVDLAVMTLSAPDKFLAREIHRDAVFLFNKGGMVRVPPLDAEAFVRGLLERRRRLVERIELFGPFVPKEIHRRNWLEALEFYRGIVLPSLVEAIRMHYGPFHHDFRMRYVYRELPPEVLRRLERLVFLKDPDDLAAKYEGPSRGFTKPSGRSTKRKSASWPRVSESTGCSGQRPGSRVAHDVLPDRRLREGVETEPVAFAKDLQRRELFLAKHGDDPIQS